MTIEQVQLLCESFPGVTTDIKWENHLCFNVGGKMFMITAPDEVPVNASFKTTDEDFEMLTEREGFIPAPYLARYKWVKIDDISRFTSAEWKQYAKRAYQLVYDKLPAKVRLQISDL
jgi:predicted DNA-binding protein (MmcQ/YjbR family)